MQFDDRKIGERFVEKIHKEAEALGTVKLMEVCGTHTQTIEKFGIRSLLPKNIELISGPGCPVCVTSTREIDEVIALAENGVTITTFGDMLKVPGTESSLSEMKTEGRDIRVVYSISDAVKIAKENSDKEVVHIAIGFETTVPSTACEIISNAPKNFSILSCHRLIPLAMEFLLKEGDVQIDGFICPGHVSAIIGLHPYEKITKKFKVPQVVAGFEPVDVIIAIEFLLRMLNEKKPAVKNEYSRVVKPEGNIKAQKIISEVFEPVDVEWRGFPKIQKSGLKLREEFSKYDARKKFNINLKPSKEPKGCICGKVLKGITKPTDCKLFAKGCTPEKPVGPCMVSTEGACGIVYKFRKR